MARNIEEKEAGDAARDMEAGDASTAAAAIEKVTTDKAARVMERVATDKAADVLEKANVVTAARVMGGLSTEKLSGVVQEMATDSLMERLPEVSPDKVHDVAAKLLLAKMPMVPAEHLVAEVAPTPPPGLRPPVKVGETANVASYMIPEGRTGEWANLVATPPPVIKLLARFTRPVQDIGLTLETLSELPSELPGLAREALVNSIFRVTLKNVTPGDANLVHFTFKVGKEWLKRNQLHKWAVALNKYDSDTGRWIELPTKWSVEDEDFVYYTATTPQLSTFAITGREQVMRLNWEVRELKVIPAAVEAGQQVTVSATVVNLSPGEATFAVPLWVNDRVEASQFITLAGGGQGTVTYTLVSGEAGLYTMRVDRLIGGFEVKGSIVTIPTPTPIPAFAPGPTPEPTSTPIPVATTTPTSAPTSTPAPAVTPAVVSQTPMPTLPPTPAAAAPGPSAGAIPAWLIPVVGAIVLAGVAAIFVTRRKR